MRVRSCVCVCLRVRACGVARVRAHHVCRIVRACLLVLVMGTLSQSSLTPFVRPSVATLCLFGVCVLLSLLVLSSWCVCFSLPLSLLGVCLWWLAFFAFFGTCFLAFFLSLSFLSGLSPSVLRVVRGHSVALSSFGCSLVQSLLDSRSSPPRSFLSLFIVTI